GKVEAGIPEDDPRNAAVIADLVGDNVGDCAGRGADLFESTAAENIGAMILGVTIYLVTHNVAWIVFPLVVRGFGLVASMIGIFTVRGSDTKSPMSSLNLGYYITVALSIAGMYLVTNQMLNEKGAGYWFFYAGVVGILTSLAFVYITQYYTAGDWRPVKEIAEAAKTGPATTIISGVAVGFETTAASAITISIALFLSHWFGDQWGAATGLPHGGIYGTAVATMGMLMSAAFILAEDTFGPITDNAGGVASMAGTEDPNYARVVDITTASALRNMIAPGLLAVGAPIVVGVLLKAEAEAALLMVGTMAGVILATVLNNGGGAWDNAKKYIESGMLKDEQGRVLGKGTPAHAAA